jgi:hypothetical protein
LKEEEEEHLRMDASRLQEEEETRLRIMATAAKVSTLEQQEEENMFALRLQRHLRKKTEATQNPQVE